MSFRTNLTNEIYFELITWVFPISFITEVTQLKLSLVFIYNDYYDIDTIK